MSAGSNGLSAVQNLSDRLKCPAHPTKRRWVDGDLAREEADRRTKSLRKRGVSIVAYLCDACGNYHLSKSEGAGSVTLADGQYSVGEFKAAAPGERVFPTPEDPEPPIVPGDFDTRVRFARRYLEQNPEPTSEEMCEALGGCTRDSLRKVMTSLGYRNTRGRSARWVKIATSDGRTKDDLVGGDPTVMDNHAAPEEDTRIPLDLSYDNDAPDKPEYEYQWTGSPLASASTRWVDLQHERIRHLAVGDLLDAYAAAGFTIRIQIGNP